MSIFVKPPVNAAIIGFLFGGNGRGLSTPNARLAAAAIRAT
jgi:hypothetical protein